MVMPTATQPQLPSPSGSRINFQCAISGRAKCPSTRVCTERKQWTARTVSFLVRIAAAQELFAGNLSSIRSRIPQTSGVPEWTSRPPTGSATAWASAKVFCQPYQASHRHARTASVATCKQFSPGCRHQQPPDSCHSGDDESFPGVSFRAPLV